jgi:hypothetical protein
MRNLPIVAPLTLAFGLALSAFGSLAHAHHAHPPTQQIKTPQIQPVAYHGRPSGHAHRGSVRHHRSASATVAHRRVSAHHLTAVKADATVSEKGRRRTALTPEPAPVLATIPPIPMKDGRLFVPPPLVGSRASLVRQNERTEADGLTRIEDDAQLNELRRQKALVAIPASLQLRVNQELPGNRRYCRPWTAKFLSDLARAHYARFHRWLQVNSAVRTVAYQRRLIEVNGNAAPAEGDIASPHLSGATIDIARKGLSMPEIAWMRAYLLPLETAGKIDVEEEFYQSCFHITVYKSYAPPAPAPLRGNATTLLAERMR